MQAVTLAQVSCVQALDNHECQFTRRATTATAEYTYGIAQQSRA